MPQIDEDHQEESTTDLKNLPASENELLDKLCLVIQMIPHNLYFMGIFIKTLNDDTRPKINPISILKILCEKYLKSKNIITDFIVLLVNQITFAKLECFSARFGELDYKCAKGIKEKYDMLHFSMRTNIELNRLFYIQNKNFTSMIDSFNFTLKNIVDNSFYVLKSIENGTGKETNLKLRSVKTLAESNPGVCIEKKSTILVSLLIPGNLMDFENFLGKNKEKAEKYVINFRTKTILHMYLPEDVKYYELLQEIKTRFIEYIGENVENILADKYLDSSSSTVFSFDVDNKYYVNYNDSIHFIMDQSMSSYAVRYVICDLI